MKVSKLTKFIKLYQKTDRGHPRNNTQVCLVTHVNLWRIGIQGRGKGDAEKRGGN